MADLVDILLAAIADEDHGIDPALAALLAGIAQHSSDLGAPGQAAHRAHQPRQFAAIRGPTADLEFVEAAIEGKPHVEAAQSAADKNISP